MTRHSVLMSIVAAVAAHWLTSTGPLDGAVFAVRRAEDQVMVTRDGRAVGEYVFRDPRIPRRMRTASRSSWRTASSRRRETKSAGA